MRPFYLLSLLFPLLTACPKPAPPGPLTPQDGAEVLDTAPFDASRVKRYKADLGLKPADQLDAVGEAWNLYVKTFEGVSKRTADHGFAVFWAFMEKNIRAADRRQEKTYANLLSSARAGQPLDLNQDEPTRVLYRNLCTLRLTSESSLAVQPDWEALGAKAERFVSDTLQTILLQLHKESVELENVFRNVPQPPQPSVCAANFDFWAGIRYDVSADFPLRPLLRDRYVLWLRKLLPALTNGTELTDYQAAWQLVADFWAEAPEGAAFRALADEANQADGFWNESLNSTRKQMLKELEAAKE